MTEGLRAVKDATELARIKKAAELSAKALARATAFFKPGICESELAGIVDLEIRRLGCKPGFETIVAFGPNASRPHHQPGPRKLRKTDTILIDFGARFEGYTADITRCFVLGKPSAAYRRACEVTARSQAAAIAAARAGAKLRDVDEAARKVVRDSGFPVYGYGTGHGIGLEIHEDPFLRPESKGTLQAGQILTIEPAGRPHRGRHPDHRKRRPGPHRCLPAPAPLIWTMIHPCAPSVILNEVKDLGDE
jgi:Xaa-Pro aminopeptidase